MIDKPLKNIEFQGARLTISTQGTEKNFGDASCRRIRGTQEIRKKGNKCVVIKHLHRQIRMLATKGKLLAGMLHGHVQGVHHHS